jgi:hypothetical protein
MKRILFFIAIVQILASDLIAQGGNTCATATALGTLPSPAACPSGIGTAVTNNGTTVGATAAIPYTYILDCGSGTTDMAAPALDVWYTFVASASAVTISIPAGSGGYLPSPNIGLYSGTCSNLAGVGCALGSANGSLTAVFEPMVPGQTYFVQVSGNNATSTGTFALSVSNSNDCSDCLQSSTFTANPLPVNGTYGIGQSVTFCFQVNSYTQVSANWLHGIQISLGSGWDPATLVDNPPASCSGSGYWDYYTALNLDPALAAWGPGFYYNYTEAGDINPADNYGDYNPPQPNGSPSTCKPKFCWTVQTDAVCVPGASLSVSVGTSSDGESGNWTSVS